MSKLTELEKLKYWLDTEITITRIILAVVLLQVTEGWVWNIVLGVYIFYAILYAIVRLSVIAADDPDYLRAPKK